VVEIVYEVVGWEVCRMVDIVVDMEVGIDVEIVVGNEKGVFEAWVIEA
jgi:hypothetical protein